MNHREGMKLSGGREDHRRLPKMENIIWCVCMCVCVCACVCTHVVAPSQKH